MGPTRALMASARSQRIGVVVLLLGPAAALWNIPGCLDALPPPLPPEDAGPADASLPDTSLPDAPLPDGDACRERADAPPGALVPAKECLDFLGSESGPGCLDDADFGCLIGEGSCSAAPACARSQPGDCVACPGRVLDWLGAGSAPACSSVDPGQIAFGNPDLQCLCGNPTCAVACDGQGPVFGAIADLNGSPKSILTIPIDRLMPDIGQVGVYLRARGTSGAELTVETDGSVKRRYPVAIPDQGEFEELVLFDNSVDDNGVPTNKPPYCWEKSQDKPILLSITPTTEGQLSLMEIDCVVPFVIPTETCAR